MPRRQRILIKNGIYHAFNRGNNKTTLFRDKTDYLKSLDLIFYAKNKYKITIYNYCLMPNHYHMLLKIFEASCLSYFIHNFQFRYAQYCKVKYGHTGHVFQERFRSPLISDESYYLQCGRYIERNPVKAGLVKKAESYPYSSAAHYVYGKKDVLATDNPYYVEIGKNFAERQKKYESYLSMEEPYQELLDRAILSA